MFIASGANSAGRAAVHFANYARCVRMIVCGDALAKSGMSQYLIDRIEEMPNLGVWYNLAAEGGWLMVEQTTEIRDRIRGLPALAEIPDEDLDRLLLDAKVLELQPEEVLIVEGETAQVAYLILEGDMEIVRSAGDDEVVIAMRSAGELVGEMALLMQARRNATVRAQTPVMVMEITGEAFATVLASRPGTAIEMLRTVWDRLQAAEAHLVQHQKMAGLGTLAAGLAHELNNPAAALLRSANQLANTVTGWESYATALGALQLEGVDRETVESLRVSLSESSTHMDELDPLARSDLEQDLQDWLEDHSIDDAWTLAPILADAGQRVEDLEGIAGQLPQEHLPILLWWLGTGTMVQRLLRELSMSAKTISEIVTAVKAYTRLDQTPIQEVDVEEGIEQALVILRHKLKNVQVRREYAENLPRITAFVGELNQVWTNLIDNASDAMNGEGRLTIRTHLDRDEVIVEIEDSGAGIATNDQQRLFNPFYTTKPPGQGTGLGLAITYNIVRKHNGEIRFESEPGRTCFAVRLPVVSDIG